MSRIKKLRTRTKKEGFAIKLTSVLEKSILGKCDREEYLMKVCCEKSISGNCD